MPKLMSPINQLQQLSLNSNEGVVYQPARGFFKVVYQGLILPNLPAPLRYFNYISLIGQPRIPLCYNANSIVTSAIDTATVLVSNSLHSVSHLKPILSEDNVNLLLIVTNLIKQILLNGKFQEFSLDEQILK